MKRIFMSMFIISMIIITACKNSTESKENQVSTNKYDNQGSVIQMTKTSFIDLVMDFEKNPHNWVFKGNKPCVVDFYADWCGPCKRVAPIMEELAKEYEGKINIYKVNVDNEKELSALFQIESIPAILFCPMSGSPQLQPGAMTKEEYKKIFDEFLLSSKSDTTKSVNK